MHTTPIYRVSVTKHTTVFNKSAIFYFFLTFIPYLFVAGHLCMQCCATLYCMTNAAAAAAAAITTRDVKFREMFLPEIFP